MADNAALAAALNNIANALLVLNNNAAGGGGGGAAAPPAHVPILDPFAADDPFDLSSRAGSVAFAAACTALEDPWDGTVEKFPPFLINLKLRAKEMGWSRAGVTNITTINGHDLFDNYFSITDAKTQASASAHLGVTGTLSDDVPDVDASTSRTETSSLSTNRSDITVLLVDALGMVRDNDLAKDLIADALNSLHNQS